MKGWVVQVAGEYQVAVSAPTAGRAKYLVWLAGYENEYFDECLKLYRVLRRPHLDGRPEGVIEDLEAWRLAGIPADENEGSMWCSCGKVPVCSGCHHCHNCGCYCEEIFGPLEIAS